MKNQKPQPYPTKKTYEPLGPDPLQKIQLRILFIEGVLKNGATERAINLLSNIGGRINETLKGCEMGQHNFEDVPTSQMLGLKQCVKCGAEEVKG